MVARRPQVLDVVIRYRGREITRERIDADPDIPNELREHLLATMDREHRRGVAAIRDYDMQVWRPKLDRNPRKPWFTYQATR